MWNKIVKLWKQPSSGDVLEAAGTALKAMNKKLDQLKASVEESTRRLDILECKKHEYAIEKIEKMAVDVIDYCVYSPITRNVKLKKKDWRVTVTCLNCKDTETRKYSEWPEKIQKAVDATTTLRTWKVKI